MDFEVGDKVYINTGAIYNGVVMELTPYGLWLTEDKKTEEYILYVEIKEWSYRK